MGGPMISEKKWGDLPFLGGPIDLSIICGDLYPFSKKIFTGDFALLSDRKKCKEKKAHCLLFLSRHELMTLFPVVSGPIFPNFP